MADVTKEKLLKAYKVEPYHGDGYSTVVFAKNRGEARNLATLTDCCHDSRFTEIRATRMPQLDAAYHGRWELEWFNERDRAALVKSGYHCESVGDDDCYECSGQMFCSIYAEWREENGT